MIEYLSPLSPNVLEYLEDLPIGTLGKEVEVYAGESALPNLENVKIAIIGVKENRADPNALESELDPGHSLCAKGSCFYPLEK